MNSVVVRIEVTLGRHGQRKETVAFHDFAWMGLHTDAEKLDHQICLAFSYHLFAFAFIITNESLQSWKEESTIAKIKNFSDN